MNNEVKILIVEDENNTAILVKNVFEKIFTEKGYYTDCTICNNGNDAGVLIGNGIKYDFVSLDINLSAEATKKDGRLVGALGTSVLKLAIDVKACKGIVIISGIMFDKGLDDIEKESELKEEDWPIDEFRKNISNILETNFPNKHHLVLKNENIDKTIKLIEDQKDDIIRVSGINERAQYKWVVDKAAKDRYDVYYFNTDTNEQEHVNIKIDKGSKYVLKILRMPNIMHKGKDLRGIITKTLPAGIVAKPVKERVDGKKISLIDYGESIHVEKELDTQRTSLLEMEISELNEVDTVKSMLNYANEYYTSYFDENKRQDKEIYKVVIIPLKIRLQELEVGELMKSLNLGERGADYFTIKEEFNTQGIKLLKMYQKNPQVESNTDFKNYLVDNLDMDTDVPISKKVEKRGQYHPGETEYTRGSVENSIKNFLNSLYSNHNDSAQGFVDHLLDSLGYSVEKSGSKLKIKKNRGALGGENWTYNQQGNPDWDFDD